MSNVVWSQVGKDDFLIFYKFRLISVIKLLIVKTLLTFFFVHKNVHFQFFIFEVEKIKNNFYEK